MKLRQGSLTVLATDLANHLSFANLTALDLHFGMLVRFQP